MSDSDVSVFVVILNDQDGKVLETVKNKVDGTMAAIDQVTELTDVPALKKVLVNRNILNKSENATHIIF